MGFIESIVERSKSLGDKILDKDINSIMDRHSNSEFKDTVERLENVFRSAVYRGTYDAFMLEKECQDRLHSY